MGNYDDYKRGRDLAWETLINSRVSSLPVELDRVAGCCGVSVISFERAVKAGYIYEDEAVGKMFAKTIDGIKTVFVNNTLENKGSIRFLIAKGIGCCILAKNPSYITERTAYEAGIFARDLLMPATVLFGLGVKDAADIARICHVSQRAAQIRAERMAQLYERNRFNGHPLEKRVRAQFDTFINENKLN